MPGRDNINSEGREANAAQPLNDLPETSNGREGAERYPSVRQDDAVERTGRTEEARSFEPPANPDPPRGAGDTSAPPSANEGRLGPGADPAEGKR